MEEKIIYTKTDFEKGSLIGSEIDSDSYLRSRFKELNEDNFTSPLYSNWQEDILDDKFIEEKLYSNNNDELRFRINKDNNQEKINEEKFGTIETYFYDKENTPIYTDVLTLNLNIEVMDNSNDESIGIKVITESGDNQEILFTNKGKIKIVTDNSGDDPLEDWITDTANESISSITNFISNNMTDFYLDFRIQNDTLYTRIRGRGFFSEWYEYQIEGLIEKLEVTQYSNIDTYNPVYKNIEINEILIDGYEDGVSYKSKVIDTEEDDTIWNRLEFNIANINQLLQYSLNEVNVEVFYSNELLTLGETSQEFIIDNIANPVLDLSDINARYLKLELKLNTKYNQNSFEYILFKYTLPSTIKDQSKQIEEITITGELLSNSVIEYDGDNFPFKIYIPDGIDAGSVEIKREKEDDSFAEGVFGFEFDPIPDINIPILIEVDYTGYEFNPFMSAKGLEIGYLDIAKNPQTLDTAVIESQKKLLAYFI